ncbi:hypothetical protein [Prolixibacter sp. NT017]|uniref:hypothetical protein n=1 Tax=Prolixibacter sp. NT017 TaxID=2652390 RepID=UPI0012993EDC|nr:hypothetical protein [Prolixibacter sp. NT017]
MSFRVSILLLMLNFGLLLLTDIACAKNKEIPGLQVEGKLRTDEGGLNGAIIEVYEADSDELNQTATVDETGKFALQLAFQHDYYFVFKNRGCYSKKLLLNAVIPEKVLKRDPYFPPIKIIVTLFREMPEIDPSFSEKPVGKIFYSAELDNFDSESYFNDKQIREKIDEEVAATYQKKLEKAKTLEDSGNLAEAVSEYQTATSLKQDDDIVLKKIASLKEQIIKQEEKATQAEVAGKESMDKQLIAASPETADTADNALETQANQSASVQKTSGDTITNETKNLAEQTRPDSAETTAQTAEVEPKKMFEDSAQKVTGETEKQEAIAATENTKTQNTEQEKAQSSSIDGEEKSLAQASIQPLEKRSGSGILLISGLMLFALIVLLWFRRKAKQKDTAENE